ncbi:MAG: glutamate-5-semialdehyde dehydrogenase [Deltaproteobacteria bacterium]|nr:glutamate-5-semialdehyde dehydrogenase [Deltaproteobacteria bacterium]MCL5277512.1 glutamate-5-semialdehyde dehydrogenase [Deltaproteobacteria bacterium]
MNRQDVLETARKARRAGLRLGVSGTAQKDAALGLMAEGLSEKRALLLEANAEDVGSARQRGMPAAFIDRLTLTDRTLKSMVDGINEVRALRDPVGEITKAWTRPNGLLVARMRIPIGVILMIYESRPNVTADASALCIKSGNAVILKGGSEAINSNRAIAGVLSDALEKAGLPSEALQFIDTPDKEVLYEFLRQDEMIDLVIPRGGGALIKAVAEHSRIPVLKHDKGICHIFVDAGADMGMAKRVCFNAKVQRPGVCNAMETLLVHRDAAQTFLPDMADMYRSAGVEIRGCDRTRAIVEDIKAATEQDWSTEYLDLVLSVRIVDSLEQAIEHINRYGSHHTDSIITRDVGSSMRFLREVDSSTVLVNASTRFSDGFQLGLGAEIGISTSKLHAFGPMGLEELTAQKFVIMGSGQIRE